MAVRHWIAARSNQVIGESPAKVIESTLVILFGPQAVCSMRVPTGDGAIKSPSP